MAPPTGNQFWKLAENAGRPATFETPEDLLKGACEYFQWAEDNPLQEEKIFHNSGEITRGTISKMRAMTLDGLCVFLGISDTTYYNHRDKSDEFLEVTKKIGQIMRTQKFTGAAADLLNPNIIARDLGLADRSENTISGPDGGAIKVQDITFNPVKPNG